MPDLDQLLRSEISLAASQAAEPRDFAIIERRAVQRRRTQTLLALSAAAVATVLTAVGSLQVAGSPRSAPTIPVQQPTATPTPTSGWTGPLRPGISLPTVSGQFESGSLADRWRDAPDAAAAGIDILDVYAGGTRRLAWGFELRGAPHEGVRPDPQGRAAEFGVVVDTDGDRVADCEFGINDNALGPEGYRVWEKNLKTGVKVEQVGGSYGYPFDFSSPEGPQDRGASLFFLSDVPWKAPLSFRPPCAPFRRSAAFYTWALLTEGGRPVAWDFAPDAAWLRMPVAARRVQQ